MSCLNFSLCSPSTVTNSRLKSKLKLIFNLTAKSSIFETVSHYAVQAGLELLDTGAPFASGSLLAGNALRHLLTYQATLLKNINIFEMIILEYKTLVPQINPLQIKFSLYLM